MATELDITDFQNWPFGEKVRYWKRHGAPGVSYQGGQTQFHEITTNQCAQRELDLAARDGRTLVPADEHGNPR